MAGDRVLESRHLIGLFVGVVILCAVFFTLGYVMGRSQYQRVGARRLRARARRGSRRSTANRCSPKEDTLRAGRRMGFLRQQEQQQLEKPAAPPKSRCACTAAFDRDEHAVCRAAGIERAPLASHNSPGAFARRPKCSDGTVILQVAAVTRQGDALGHGGRPAAEEISVRSCWRPPATTSIACKSAPIRTSAPPTTPGAHLTALVSRLSSSAE